MTRNSAAGKILISKQALKLTNGVDKVKFTKGGDIKSGVYCGYNNLLTIRLKAPKIRRFVFYHASREI